MRSLLTEFLGSERAASEFRRRAEAAERRQRLAARTCAGGTFDVGRWLGQHEAEQPSPRPAPPAVPAGLLGVIRAEARAAGRAEVRRELDALRAEVVQALTEIRGR